MKSTALKFPVESTTRTTHSRHYSNHVSFLPFIEKSQEPYKGLHFSLHLHLCDATRAGVPLPCATINVWDAFTEGFVNTVRLVHSCRKCNMHPTYGVPNKKVADAKH